MSAFASDDLILLPEITAEQRPPSRRGMWLGVAAVGVFGALSVFAGLTVMIGTAVLVTLTQAEPEIAPVVALAPVDAVAEEAPVEDEVDRAAETAPGPASASRAPVAAASAASAHRAVPKTPTPPPTVADVAGDIPPLSAPPSAAAEVPVPATGTATDTLPDGRTMVRLLTMPPGAQVTVDDTLVGPSPVDVALEPGDHSVVIAKNKASGTFTVSVEPGSPTRYCYGVRGKKVLDNCL